MEPPDSLATSAPLPSLITGPQLTRCAGGSKREPRVSKNRRTITPIRHFNGHDSAMESADGRQVVVDPEVKAYVSSLVSALGGSGADEDGRYVLGDDALACLRDLKRWLKLYHEKANRLDVARCLAEANLVGGDLLQILAAWPENATDDRLKSRIALSCLELLVPLTWPIEKDYQTMTVNHHRHIPYLQLAQLGYKRAIISFDGARILHTAVRIALPAMAEPLSERSSRDEGIIKLVLYFLRNMAMIAPQPNVTYDGDDNDISRSATIETFHWQDIFHLLLTVCSTMGEDFNTQDVIVMEISFYLIKGIDVEKLFMSEEQLDLSKTDELVRLRTKEAGMKRGYARTAPTRHSRFGTMVWVKRDDEKMSTVSGQDALKDGAKSLAKMDNAKKFKPPRRALKGDSGPQDFDTPVSLEPQATKNLRGFVEDFLDSGFNPLFQHIRKAIDREAERVLDYHPTQFFYLISWFLEAERIRRKKKKSAKSRIPEDVDSFALVAGVLNQEMFITLNRAMEKSYDTKSWQDLNAAMKCFTQILLTVQEMSESPLEDDQDIAENILSRIFYEEATHDRVATIVRYYKDQGFGYLDSCTELAHTYIRMLEQYSKQNVDLQVRSRKRVRRKKKSARNAEDDSARDDIANDDSEAEDESRAERASQDRKFDFKRFSAHFLSQGCVDTFVKFASYYADLLPLQLKRAHRFFHRVAFKMEMSVMLFRVDIMALFHKMIKGPEGLDPSSPTFKEWEELIKQLIKRCTRKIHERPELVIEMLFSKINATAHYLEYGYEKQTVTSRPRAAAELEIKGGMDWEQQIGVVVSALLDKNQGDHIEWVKPQLTEAESERRSWESMNIAVQSVEEDPFADTPESGAAPIEPPVSPPIFLKADTAARKTAMFKNGHLRLLMTLIGFKRLGDYNDPDGSWTVPSSLPADQLREALELIKKFEFSPPSFDDGKEAEDFVRRKSAGSGNRKRQAFDDEDDDIDDDDEELFPVGGPTARKTDAIKQLKKSRRRRRQVNSGDEDEALVDEKRAAKEEARKARELEKRRKIKSALTVHDSDDASDLENDTEFFAREEQLRKWTKVAVMKSLQSAAQEKRISEGASKKRDTSAISLDSDSDNDNDNDETPLTKTRRRSSSISVRKAAAGASDDAELTDTPISSPYIRSSQAKRLRVSREGTGSRTITPAAASPKDVHMAEVVTVSDDDDDDVPVVRTVRKRTYGFLADSSDEE